MRKLSVQAPRGVVLMCVGTNPRQLMIGITSWPVTMPSGLDLV
jgi:hypothetical protein